MDAGKAEKCRRESGSSECSGCALYKKADCTEAYLGCPHGVKFNARTEVCAGCGRFDTCCEIRNRRR